MVNLIQDEILNYDVAFADETTVQVLKEPNRCAETKSYMWCFLGGPPNKRVAIYQYHASRGSEVANQFFAGYHGTHSSASMYSLIETAKLHDLNPPKYLAYIFNELPKCTELAELEALLPYNILKLQLASLKISTCMGLGE